MITVTQSSDVYQYLVGTHLGQNKTYEGYLGGLILTVLSLIGLKSSVFIYDIRRTWIILF
jgi:predicted CDP-diglyceride synthetase/phosphatidate cytidylyltransferase